MHDPAATAQLLLSARQSGRRLQGLPEALRPADEAQAYAVQDVMQRALGPIAGWKVGAPSPDGPISCAPLPAPAVFRSPQRFAPGRFALQLVEAELGFTFARDLPPRAAPYTEADVLAAIGSVHATIEIIDTAFADFRSIDPLAKLADLAVNGALVVGPGRTSELRIDQTRTPVTVRFDDRLEIEVTGGNVAGDVFRLLVWLANHAAARSGGLRQGTVVTTGSCIGARHAPPGTRVRAVFPGIPEVEATV